MVGTVILTLRPMLFVGKISYSAYLWHWPIVVYYRIYINERAFNFVEVILLSLASLLAGYFSWKFIEEKYRYLKFPEKKVFRIMLLLFFTYTASSCGN